MRCRTRLARLERQLQAEMQLFREQEERRAAELRRWDEVLNAFGAVLPDDLNEPVTAALEGGRAPLWGWLENLVRGRCRLPECLTEDVVRRLVTVYLDADAAEAASLSGVCLRCGLQYPLPNFPSSAQCDCPACDEGSLRRAESRARGLAVYERLFDGRGCPACGASTKAGEMNWAHLMPDGYWFAPGQASTGASP
jgi:hypothetical protein